MHRQCYVAKKSSFSQLRSNPKMIKVANKSRINLQTNPEVFLAGVTHYKETLLYAVRFLRSDENIIFAAVMPSVRMFTAQDKRAL